MTKRKPSTPQPPAARAAEEILRIHGARVAPKAVHLVTPVPSTVPLAKVRAAPEIRSIVEAYEPRAASTGVYSHQAEVLESLGGKLRNVVLTTSTGSGKSLAFWSWAFDLLRRDPEATVIACFPTQALLWGQADRLRKLSEPGSVVMRSEQAFAGKIERGGLSMPWSVWYGTTSCEDMKAQEPSESFEAARIRICTLDKAHWSLMQGRHEYFLERLAGVIVDEGHVWQGVSGAHVRRMFDRLRVSMDVLERGAPAFFIASATLPDAPRFASLLTGEPEASFLAVDDAGAQRHEIVDASDVPRLLREAPGQPGLHRYVYLLRPEPEQVAVGEFLSDETVMGSDTAALCFVQSKYGGHLLVTELERDLPSRSAIAYDADMSPKERRKVERDFQKGQQGTTYVATSALEVGVDLPSLDLVVMDQLPARRADLLQRLGRVGRSSDRPGLGVLLLGSGPADLRLLESPDALVTGASRPPALPLHLDSLRLKAIKACTLEWAKRAKSPKARARLEKALEAHLGEALGGATLEERITQELEGLVDLDSANWCYQGFRASASQGKRPLVLEKTGREVAQIQDIAVFRDAHPEAVYLGHKGERFRVKRYEGRFTLAEWRHPDSPVVLGKFMHQLQRIIVEQVPERITTRGQWEDSFTLYERKELPSEATEPRVGAIEYGIWDFLRHFDGYKEIDLARKGRTKRVTLAEISKRFKQAVEDGASFPFLHDFTYRTLGWQWQLARVLPDAEERQRLAPTLEVLLHAWFCDAAEGAPGDLDVELSPIDGLLRVVDTTPGGNGLSAALLEDRVPAALESAKRAVKLAAKRGPEGLARWLLEEHGVETEAAPKEVIDGLEKLEGAWKSIGAGAPAAGSRAGQGTPAHRPVA